MSQAQPFHQWESEPSSTLGAGPRICHRAALFGIVALSALISGSTGTEELGCVCITESYSKAVPSILPGCHANEEETRTDVICRITLLTQNPSSL